MINVLNDKCATHEYCFNTVNIRLLFGTCRFTDQLTTRPLPGERILHRHVTPAPVRNSHSPPLLAPAPGRWSIELET